MDQPKVRLTPQEVTEAFRKNKKTVNQERIAILRDAASDTYGDSQLVIPDQFKRAPLSGTVVVIGPNVPEFFFVGQEVNFNKYNVQEFYVAFDDMEPFCVDILHHSDIYIMDEV